MKKIAQVARRHRTTVFALLASFAFSAIVAYATPPSSPYSPAETLDPTCAPGDSNCSVLIIPSQTSNSGKYLTTDGTTLSWGTALSLIGSTSSLGTETWLGSSAASLGTASPFRTVFVGVDAGKDSSSAPYSVFTGYDAGYQATSAAQSVFSGYAAGYQASNASYATFIGSGTGYQATDANSSVFIGSNAGTFATGASGSVFAGVNAGNAASSAINSVFIGPTSGSSATSAANSIFLGNRAGYTDTVNNTALYNDINTFANTSILIGYKTSTGGFSNSIALGAYTTNTKTNQFMIGSSNRGINEVAIIGSAGQSCTIRPDSPGINCSSDERLKTNIVDLSSALDMLSGVRVVSYNWNNTPNTNPQIGFLAQDLQTHVPTLVSSAANGYYQVNYAGMTPLLVKAVQELDQKIQALTPLDNSSGTTLATLRTWLGDAQNAIEKLFAKEVQTQKLCLSDEAGNTTCVTKQDLDRLLVPQVQEQPQTIESNPIPEPEVPSAE